MAHHSPFKSLSPLSWSKDIAPRDPASLTDLLATTFADAQLLIDSIPTPPPSPPTPSRSSPGGRARSHTDSAVPVPVPVPLPLPLPPSNNNNSNQKEKETLQKLTRDWKDLKLLPPAGAGPSSSNPHGIAMYKMGAKDGKGAWFARRSLHQHHHSSTSSKSSSSSSDFEKWEAALKREMDETIARVEAVPGKEAGTGNVRGIGAERRVGGLEGEGGRVSLYHVSARFPGPTTPRDFVALIMMPQREEEEKTKKGRSGKNRAPRQFMIVSRPCEHPDCPPRPGFIRGTYESVEVIREVPVEKPLRRVRSSVDMSRDELKGALHGDRMDKKAVLRAAKRAVGEEAESEGEGRTVSFRLADDGDGNDTEMAIEWLMVTRSDPGGSVPRFMVEKGTPGGIINDAGKFLKWLSSQTMEDLTKPRMSQTDVTGQRETKPTGESPVEETPGQLPADTSAQDQLLDGEVEYQEEMPQASNSGIYGMLTSALGLATSAVAGRVAAFAPSSKATDSDISDAESDTSEASFASAEEGSGSQPDTTLPNSNNITETTSELDNTSTRSAHSTLSDLSREPTASAGGGALSQAQFQHEKELRKLQQRMRKAQEKLERTQARRRAKSSNGATTASSNGEADTTDPLTGTAASVKEAEKKDDAALAKLRDKHAREVARQEEKYQRELQRLADKRAAEARKAEERRKKAAEREGKADLAMALERVKAERDVARKEVDMLSERVGELQAQNTMLVARLGREGVDAGELREGK
ncbi:hypothetical protein C8A00DRAFT_30385 [Chaetomidium leptoderma]|uniref:DUF3074 domain-containing protein n=1 Tax=Chaetomidium leptoderma TaxID=669021 RepID=A0AAN6VRY2_9PEZI|nr:hypothetical protein C8A00DRAFT_30385 [Chaetomidium leptoderma]